MFHCHTATLHTCYSYQYGTGFLFGFCFFCFGKFNAMKTLESVEIKLRWLKGCKTWNDDEQEVKWGQSQSQPWQSYTRQWAMPAVKHSNTPASNLQGFSWNATAKKLRRLVQLAVKLGGILSERHIDLSLALKIFPPKFVNLPLVY